MEALKMYIDDAKERMTKAIAHLEDEMATVRAGKANTSIVNNITVNVEAYGSTMPLNQTANISTPDAKTIMIKPWDKTVLADIEKAILASNIGLTPQNDGEQIRLNLPPLTEERRKDLVKHIHNLGEQAKISLRAARRDAIDGVRDAGKEVHAGEDMIKDYEQDIQDVTVEFGKKVDARVAAKEKEIMTV